MGAGNKKTAARAPTPARAHHLTPKKAATSRWSSRTARRRRLTFGSCWPTCRRCQTSWCVVSVCVALDAAAGQRRAPPSRAKNTRPRNQHHRNPHTTPAKGGRRLVRGAAQHRAGLVRLPHQARARALLFVVCECVCACARGSTNTQRTHTKKQNRSSARSSSGTTARSKTCRRCRA